MIPQEAAKSFSRFFQEKIETIRQEFNDDPLDTTENFASSVHSSDILSSFYALSEDQILKLIRESKSTTATVDPAPTKPVLEFTDVLLPVFQKIVNLSLTSFTVPIAFKQAVVKPLIKKKSQILTPRSSETTVRCPTYPICPRSLRERLPTSCRHTLTQTVCMLSFSRRTDVVIAPRRPSFAYLTIFW